MNRAACWLVALLLGPAAFAAAPPTVDLQQHIGDSLPLGIALRAEDARAVRLADYFGSTPVVLVLGYYRCPNLCSTLMEGTLQALAAATRPGDHSRIVAVSIDPRETPAIAAAKKGSYAAWLDGGAIELHLLTGDAAGLKQLEDAVGMTVSYDEASGQYGHPAAFVIATPAGRILRYFSGVRFDPGEVRRALNDAAAATAADSERAALISSQPLVQFVLRCLHYDPATGRYSASIMAVVRALGVALVVALASWVIGHRATR